MFISKINCLSCVLFCVSSVCVSSVSGGQLSSSIQVQANIALLKENKSCPGCDLSGADLNRFDLSDANLERANLSRAKMYLVDLSGANLRNADLQEAELGGADLADADLRGANLTGVSFAGAYIKGALFDGEMISSTPYARDNISDVQEIVYVEDTVNAKAIPETEEIVIASRRDFEETPPSATVEESPAPVSKSTQQAGILEKSVPAPDAKAVPAMQSVRIHDEGERDHFEESPEVVPAVAPLPDITNKKEDAPQAETALQEHIEVAAVSDAVTLSSEVTQSLERLLDTNKCYGCNLGGVLLKGENLDSADLEGADLSGADLSDADLEGANLKGANLTNADLSGADLSGADLYKANLTNADLTGATLEQTLLDDTTMEGAKVVQPPLLFPESN